MFLVLGLTQAIPKQREKTLRIMTVDKDTGYGIPGITIYFNKIPLTTNDEGLITYTYKQIGKKRKQFFVSVPDSPNYSSAVEQRVKGRFFVVKLQSKLQKTVSGSISFVDAISGKSVRSSVVIVKNGVKLGRWQAQKGQIKLYSDQATLGEQLTLQIRGTGAYNSTMQTIQLQQYQTVKIARNEKYSVDMGFIIRNMGTRKRVKDALITVTVNGQQSYKQADTDGEFFIRSADSPSFFRRQNVTVSVSRNGAQVYTNVYKYPIMSRWYTINLK